MSWAHDPQLSVGTLWEQTGIDSSRLESGASRTGVAWSRLEGSMQVGCVGFLNFWSQV